MMLLSLCLTGDSGRYLLLWKCAGGVSLLVDFTMIIGRLVWSRPVSVMIVTCRERVWRPVYVVVCLCRRVAEFVSGVGEVGSYCNR
jgi:hypothetical protein